MGDFSGAGTNPIYEKLIALLDASQAKYDVFDHAMEGQTDRVSEMRGHPVREAAKCIVLIIKQGKKTSKFVLAVVPGDCRVDINAVKKLFNATYTGFAATEVAEKLAGSVAGTVLPFTFKEELGLIVDRQIANSEWMYFNAARLDRSLKLATVDYLAITKPRLESIAVR